MSDPVSIIDPIDIVDVEINGNITNDDRTNAALLHSVNFKIGNATYNTWWTWRLIPNPRPSITMPKVRTKYVDVPGMHGQMDISEILTGKPIYENRKGSWEFYISRRPRSDGTVYPWYIIWHKIAEALHGKTGTVWLEDDPYRVYTGRFAVNEKFNTQKDYSKITIEYTLDPFAEDNAKEGADGWLWDPFNFYNDAVDISKNPQTLIKKKEQL